VGQRHGEKLVGTQAEVVAVGAVQHVVAVAHLRVPETAEARLRLRRQRLVDRFVLAKLARKVGHNAQRAVPERVDLHRLAGARRDHPVVHFGVHPGELHPFLAGVEQAVLGVHVDVVARAAPVPVDNLHEHREEVAQQASLLVAA
jgi:hypothetical protein